MSNFIKNEKGAVIPFLFISAYLLFILLIPFRACASVDAGLDALSHHELAKAEKIFAEQADKGDVHARYWQANAMFLQRGEKAFAAGQIMLQAAKKGDPWAMNRLAPSNNESPCGMFGWPCDSKWLDKALAIWKKQAEQGDGNAELALLLRDRPWYTKYIPILSKKLYANKVIDSFHHGSDYAALKSFNMDLDNSENYIKELADKGNCEAMFDYGVLFDEKSSKYLDWMNKASICGNGKAALYSRIAYKKQKKYKKSIFLFSKISWRSDGID
ncbi:hypothetical protein [Celerinatantimonas sp. MCCC 1A17872]|uniref:hypothetical protein n=1 Tax=Celerinatantimonas sp. MCCC 1A17872 TaxID=3177514 RepID=UPI0038CB49F4